MQTDKLPVITTVFNASGFQRRYDLYGDFARRMRNQDADLYTVEIAYHDQPFMVTQAGNDHHIQLRSTSVMFHKENASNVGTTFLPPDWEYVAFLDCDVQFLDDRWITHSLEALQQYAFLQPFSCTMEVTHEHIPYQFARGAAWANLHAALKARQRHARTLRGQSAVQPLIPGSRISPGGAYCFRRDTFEALQGLPEFQLVGGGDSVLMAAALHGKVFPFRGTLTKGYATVLKQFTQRTYDLCANKVGYVDGLMIFHWHGSKELRSYNTRHDHLTNNNYDPTTDLIHNADGVAEWVKTCPRQYKLSQDVEHYFLSRNEDSLSYNSAENNLEGLQFPGDRAE